MLLSTQTCGALLLTSLALVSQAQAHVVANLKYDGSQLQGLSARHLPKRDVNQPALSERELYEHNTNADKRDVDGVLIAERNVYDPDLFERDAHVAQFLDENLYKRYIELVMEEDLHARGLPLRMGPPRSPATGPPRSPSKGPSRSPSPRRLCTGKIKSGHSRGRRSPTGSVHSIHQVDMGLIEFSQAPEPIGTDGMCGCTGIIITSTSGTLIGHLDEIPNDQQFEGSWKHKLQTTINTHQAALAHGKAYIMYPTKKSTEPIYPNQLRMLEQAIAQVLPNVHVKPVGYFPLDYADPLFGKPYGYLEVTYQNGQPAVTIESKPV